MNLSIPEIRVDPPMCCEGLAVFPLYSERLSEGDPAFVLAAEAMDAGTCVVREVSEEGSVSELLAVNAGDTPVLFVEGEVLRGAKQDRVLRSSVLVAGGGHTRVPVCCVERGRWEYAGRRFAPGSCCPPTMRLLLKQAAYSAGAVRVAAQASLWRAVRRNHRATATRSERENMSDTLDAHRDRAEDLRHRLPWPEGASGIAVVLGGRAVSVDVFDKPETLANIWGRFVDGIVFDALAAPDTRRQASGADLPVKLYRLKDAAWRRTAASGLGETFRAEDDGLLASALCLADVTVHLGVAFTA